MASSSSLSRSRIRFRALAEVPAMDGDGWSDAEAESDVGDDDAELESMTGKGIKRMCSELLELKKAADEDFERNVYSSYSTFIRIFEEVGSVESELVELEQLVLTQGKLVQVLASSLNAETFTYGLKDDKVEDLGESSNSVFDTHMQDTLETLDVLLLERRLEEALAILEKETLTLKNQENLSSPFVMLCTQALQDRRTRITNQYVLMAEHPRVAQPELQKLLSGLCRLGENHRANFLLLKVYSSRLQKSIHELECLKPYLHGIYIRELAKVVFSAISQAAKCFKTLNGETTPYTSDLIQWAREETESFSHNFCTHVKSISQMNGALSMTVEASINGISFCSLLKPQKIVSQSKLMELIRPCIEEVLQIHVDHFKKDVWLFTTSDNWDLDRFPISGLFRDKSLLTGFGDNVEYYLFTSSGREFVTLMLAIVDDISPLVSLQMGCSILKSLTDLFIEYICALERAIPSKDTEKSHDSPIANSARSLQQQLSLLVNSSTLVHFSQRIAGSLSKGLISLNNGPSSDYVELFAQKELDIWVLSIQEATDQLRAYFCQQFVYGVMSHGYFDSGISLDGWLIPSSSQDPVPSLALQALFLQMRQLEKLAKSIFVEKDELTEVLLTEIVKTVIIWISENQGFWTKAVELSCNIQCGCLEQVRLDIHFLMEISRIGEYFSDDLMGAALDLITQLDAAFAISESDPNGAVPDERWGADAARLAIRKLLEAEVANSELEEEPEATSEEELSTEKWETDTEDSVGTSDDPTRIVDEIATAIDGDITRLIAIEDTDSYKEQACGHTKNEYDDSDESRTSRIQYADKEDREDATSTDDEAHGVSETQEIKEIKVQGRIMKAEVKTIDNLDENDVKEDVQKNVVKGNLVWGAELLEVENFREREAVEDLELEWLATTLEVESVNLASEVSFLEADSLRVMEGIRELKLEGLAPDSLSHVGSVSNLQERDAIAAQPAKEEPLYIARKENIFLEFELPEPDRLTEINTVKVLEVERLATYLDDSDAIAAQPAAGRQQDIAISCAHGPKRKLVGVIENLDITVTHSNDSGANNFAGVYNITSDNLVEAPRHDTENGSDTTDEFPQTATDEQQDIAKNENHGQQRKQVSDQSEVSVMQSDVSCAEMSADIDNNPSESFLEIPGPDMDKISAISDGLVQVDGSKVDEAAMHQPETSGEVDKVLSTKLSELALETSEENKSNYGDESLGQNRNISCSTVQRKNGRRRRTVPLSDANGGKESCGGNSLGTNKNTSTDPAREKSGRKRRTLSSEENGGNGGKGSKALRPQWH
ncbi:exocyst complex component EXO84B-like [Iris pallida]|uniref:Exocyst complex component EXO84B-like n=1 Tax=Iris pallida TaxID=29817 RepID=A0AAX6GSB2_IRIPA|nr:exocyst complex component EXO84B-like [Iris pallida]